MSNTINQVVLAGVLERDSDLRATGTGKPVASTTIALTEVFPQQDGTVKHYTNRFNLTAFGPIADTLGQGRKDDRVLVSGALATESWMDKATNKRQYKVVVKVDRVVFLDADQGQPSQPQTQAPAQPAPSGRQPTAREMAQKNVQEDDGDQVPF